MGSPRGSRTTVRDLPSQISFRFRRDHGGSDDQHEKGRCATYFFSHRADLQTELQTAITSLSELRSSSNFSPCLRCTSSHGCNPNHALLTCYAAITLLQCPQICFHSQEAPSNSSRASAVDYSRTVRPKVAILDAFESSRPGASFAPIHTPRRYKIYP